MGRKIVCPQCGSKRYAKDNFCVKCGAKLKNFCRRCKFDQKARSCGYDKCPSLHIYIKEKVIGKNFKD